MPPYVSARHRGRRRNIARTSRPRRPATPSPRRGGPDAALRRVLALMLTLLAVLLFAPAVARSAAPAGRATPAVSRHAPRPSSPRAARFDDSRTLLHPDEPPARVFARAEGG